MGVSGDDAGTPCGRLKERLGKYTRQIFLPHTTRQRMLSGIASTAFVHGLNLSPYKRLYVTDYLKQHCPDRRLKALGVPTALLMKDNVCKTHHFA